MALISFEDDNWVGEHDACEAFHRAIQTNLVAWSAENRTSPLYGQLSVEVRAKLKQFRTEILRLSELLDKTRREQIITDAEHERRFRQIEVLQSKYTQLQNQFNSGIQSAANRSYNRDSNQDRQELFGNFSGSRANKRGEVSTVNWNAESDDEELLGDGKSSIQTFKEKQAQIMDEQERGLEELSKIIARQKNLSQNMGNEIVLQNEIIDDLGTHMDRTNDRVRSETGRIRVVEAKENTCGYWLVIILLFISILVVKFAF